MANALSSAAFLRLAYAKHPHTARSRNGAVRVNQSTRLNSLKIIYIKILTKSFKSVSLFKSIENFRAFPFLSIPFLRFISLRAKNSFDRSNVFIFYYVHIIRDILNIFYIISFQCPLLSLESSYMLTTLMQHAIVSTHFLVSPRTGPLAMHNPFR